MTADSPVARLVPTKPDAELAADHKARLAEKLKEVLAILDDAKADGFVLSFNLGPGWDGKHAIQQLGARKEY